MKMLPSKIACFTAQSQIFKAHHLVMMNREKMLRKLKTNIYSMDFFPDESGERKCNNSS